MTDLLVKQGVITDTSRTKPNQMKAVPNRKNRPVFVNHQHQNLSRLSQILINKVKMSCQCTLKRWHIHFKIIKLLSYGYYSDIFKRILLNLVSWTPF